MKAWQTALLVALLALLVGGLLLAVTTAFELDRTRLEATRTPVPGSRVVVLEGRRYNLLYEAAGADESSSAPVLVRIRPVGGDSPLPLDDYGGELTIDSGGRPARAIASVRVERAGAYRLSATGSARGAVPEGASVVLGEPPGRRIVTIVIGGVLAAVAFLSGLLLVIVVLVRRSRARS